MIREVSHVCRSYIYVFKLNDPKSIQLRIFQGKVLFSKPNLLVIWKKVKVKVSHSLIAVGAVGVRVPLYLGHS